MDTSTLISKLEQLRSLADECLHSLQGGAFQASAATPAANNTVSSEDVDFSVPARPFMKTFVGLSGAKKFVLLVAWLVKGDLEKQVALSDVESLWASMAGMLGVKFNRKFSSDAKDFDWVQSKKTGFYNLRPHWKHALGTK